MTIQLTEEQARVLAELAGRQRKPVEELARQGVDQYLKKATETTRRKRRWFEAMASLHLG